MLFECCLPMHQVVVNWTLSEA